MNSQNQEPEAIKPDPVHEPESDVANPINYENSKKEMVAFSRTGRGSSIGRCFGMVLAQPLDG